MEGSILAELGLQSMDVGGAGDCFFRSVSHQLYGNCNYHMNIRAVGVQYMTDHPERYIESNTQSSWLRYLHNMYMVHGLMHLLSKQLLMQ
ncbi:hypothetical protein AC249_AIPGENE258 [Exaiptasia diaphana]|nr:hypothetical protein AC249_AIPGENE258 [Exaiptasia diaphana]